jgi:hypothetical protein
LGVKEEKTKRRTPNFSRSRSKGFTHKEMILIGQRVDLDLLYIFSLIDAQIKSSDGERDCNLMQNVNNGGEELEKEEVPMREVEEGLKDGPRFSAHWVHSG